MRPAIPGIQISLTNVPYVDPYEPLRRDEVDVLISYLIVDPLEEPDLTTGPAIHHTARVLVVAAGDPLAGRPSLSIEDLAGRRTVARPPRLPRALFDHFVPPATPLGEPIHRTYDLGEGDAYGAAVAAAARGHIVHLSADIFTPLLAHRHDLDLIASAICPISRSASSGSPPARTPPSAPSPTPPRASPRPLRATEPEGPHGDARRDDTSGGSRADGRPHRSGGGGLSSIPPIGCARRRWTSPMDEVPGCGRVPGGN
ncbi:LysR family transcriptional regulator substrate-binding protein [Actinomadura citrea]|uniref:LysR family transcriptional regulator substrate-binding protein n=1 Tax=Actinomadura citrea TaxID=46158 RepID=UPI0039A537D3